jgi:GTP-binding nuclear protein Ran
MQTSNSLEDINVAFIGDGGVGKTSYINRITQGIFEPRYISTIGYTTYHIPGNKSKQESLLNTNNSFNVFDFAGQEKYGLDLDLEIDFYIIFFDLNNILSFKNCDMWLNKIRKRNSNAKVILVATKYDLINRKIKKSTIKNYITKRDISKCIEISNKSCYNWEKPFEYLDI